MNESVIRWLERCRADGVHEAEVIPGPNGVYHLTLLYRLGVFSQGICFN